MPEFPWLRRQTRLDVTQALPERQLGERHRPILLGAREGLNPTIATVARDDPRKCAPRQAIHQLREQRLSDIHGRVLPGQGSGETAQTSNRHHPKLPKNPL